ncbi:metallopeptidase family protein [Stakelama saccharophila]|uniref:Metallopeptidase family protein n=1 Tax=Stakelama saccharophila TaxID=3075605 RepID=A0ABZ0B7X6_9SPHN|nr:metallopeptidase family protein [Stakelama sp. W311]WNO53389.1 metallopeptidase family protein [Stakelama sp. W311]
MIERLAWDALGRIPEPFARHLGDIVMVVEEFADAETLAHFGMTDPYQLTGLYRGLPIGDKSSFDIAPYPDEIHLYRRPLIAEWQETGVDFDKLITHVVVHEVGHHFGLSDDDMHALEDAAG